MVPEISTDVCIVAGTVSVTACSVHSLHTVFVFVTFTVDTVGTTSKDVRLPLVWVTVFEQLVTVVYTISLVTTPTVEVRMTTVSGGGVGVLGELGCDKFPIGVEAMTEDSGGILDSRVTGGGLTRGDDSTGTLGRGISVVEVTGGGDSTGRLGTGMPVSEVRGGGDSTGRLGTGMPVSEVRGGGDSIGRLGTGTSVAEVTGISEVEYSGCDT